MSSRVVRWAIPALVILNVLLLLRLVGLIPQLTGDAPDPARIARQINPDQVRIVPSSRP
ncbi:MAG: hypothetical protein AB7P21_16985 [Lautropia sp.]